ncbi:MAG: DUF1080 domain-containing protein [Gemmataceae bacterium]
MRFMCATLAAVLAAGAVTADDGFRPLFNGKDLSGWVAVNNAPGTFTVRDGLIVTTGKPTGFLRSERMFENFVVELEWKHVHPKGNSGVFVWADPLPAVGVPFARAIEVQVLDGHETKNYTSHGDVFSIWGATMTPDRPHPAGWARCLPSERRSKPAGQWNHYRIECRDGVLKLAVNGKVVSGGSRCSPRKGYLALEAEGSECHYRNLRIKELPSTNPKEGEIADDRTGFVTLFTGLDLAGWKADDAGGWKALPGPNILRHDGAKAGTLRTDATFSDFELIVDYRSTGKGAATLLLRGVEGGKVPLDGTTGKGWSRYEIRLAGNRLVVKLNGKTVLANRLDQLPARGPIGLHADGAAEFTNLFVRELK